MTPRRPRGVIPSQYLRPLAFGGALFLNVLGLATIRDTAMETYISHHGYEDTYYLPPPLWLEVMSLGHRRALADLIWLKSLVYVGEEFHEHGGLANVFRYADAMVTLDPQFRRAYRWIGVAGLYQPEESSLEDAEATVAFLRRGVAEFPDDGELIWDLATTLDYELKPRLREGSARRAAVDREATDLMLEAARRGAGPQWLTILNVTQLKASGQIERAISHLEEMYSVIRDPAVREQIAIQLEQLRGQAEADAFVHVNQDFDRRWQEEYPWIPQGLFLLVEDAAPRDE